MSWEPIFDGLLWHRVKPARSGLELRSVALELHGGGTLVYSPTRRLVVEELSEHAGHVRYLLAPNHFHYLGISEWAAQCPGAVAVASAVARRRLVKKVNLPWVDLEELSAHLPDSARLVVPPGTKNGEAWLEVLRGGERALVVCDAFFNLRELPKGLAGFFCRITETAPGLQLGKTWRYLALSDRAAYKAFLLDYLDKHPPSILVASHGELARGPDLATKLRDLVRARL